MVTRFNKTEISHICPVDVSLFSIVFSSQITPFILPLPPHAAPSNHSLTRQPHSYIPSRSFSFSFPLPSTERAFCHDKCTWVCVCVCGGGERDGLGVLFLAYNCDLVLRAGNAPHKFRPLNFAWMALLGSSGWLLLPRTS